MLRFILGALGALLWPDLTGLDLPYEHEMFFLEHYLGVVINPIILILSNKFHLSINIK